MMVYVPALKPNEVVSLADAVAVYAHYDARPPEPDRKAKQRARSRIAYAVDKGILAEAANGSFATNDFVAWATSVNKAMRGIFPGFTEGEYVARVNGKVVAYRPGASVVMEPYTSLDEANRQAILDKLLIKVLRKELAEHQLEVRRQNNRMRKARKYKQARQHGK